MSHDFQNLFSDLSSALNGETASKEELTAAVELSSLVMMVNVLRMGLQAIDDSTTKERLGTTRSFVISTYDKGFKDPVMRGFLMTMNQSGVELQDGESFVDTCVDVARRNVTRSDLSPTEHEACVWALRHLSVPNRS